MWDPDYMQFMGLAGIHEIVEPDDVEGTVLFDFDVINDNDNGTPFSPEEVVVVDDEDGGADVMEVEDERRSPIDVDKGVSTESVEGDKHDLMGEFSRGEIDGLFCPICYEAWSSGGDHNICCLPCGHIYGLSCIKKWLGRQGSSKCPQCKRKCKTKDIRLLYASRVVAIDGELQKKVQSFEAKCAFFEKMSAQWAKKEVELKKKEAELRKQVQYLKERTHNLEELLEDMERRACKSNCAGDDSGPSLHTGGSHIFKMQKEFQIQGARLFGIDSCSKTFVFSRRLSGMGGAHILTKVSLFSNHEREDIHLAENIKVVKDLQVSPHGGLVLLASLGKKLSVLSTQSNNTVITYNLPAAAWSCSWDICNSHYLYAGLQNGTVLQFDMRHTARHVESLAGPSDKLAHTLHSLSSDKSHISGIRSVLSASALGLCQLNFGGNKEGPCLIPESDKEGVCISLACSNSSDYITASYRPKTEGAHDMGVSQASGQATTTTGSHVLYRKVGETYQKVRSTRGNVSDIRLPIRSAIIDEVWKNPVFVSGDEFTSEVVFQELPTLTVLERIEPQNCPIYDVRYSRVLDSGVVGCLSKDTFRLYTAMLV